MTVIETATADVPHPNPPPRAGAGQGGGKRPPTRFLRWLVVIVFSLLAILGAATAWLLTSEAALDWALARAQARLPGELRVGAISGRLLGPVSLTDVVYRADTTVRIKRVEFDWRPWALAYGRLHFTDVRVTDVTIDLADKEQRRPHTAWRVPIPIRIDRGDLQQLRVRRANADWFSVDHIVLAARADTRNLEISRLEIDAQLLSLSAKGELGTADGIHIAWRAHPPGHPAWAGSGTLRGDLRRLQISQRLAQPFAATLDAQLDLSAPVPRFETRLAFADTDLRRISETWPALTLTGQIDAHGNADDFGADARLRLRYGVVDLDVDAALQRRKDVVTLSRLVARMPDSPGAMRADGRYQLGTDPAPLSLRLDWSDWQWPGGIALSPAGTARLDGTLADYRVHAASSFHAPRLPPLHARIDAHGDATTLTLDALTLTTLNGTVSGVGRLQRDPWRWQLDVRGAALDPSAYWPTWPGRLALNARVRGSYAAKRLRNELALTTLSGTLNDRSAIAGGRWTVDGDTHVFTDVTARVGTAHVSAHGRIDRSWDIAVTATLPHLGALAPAANGSVRAQTRLSGNRAAPVIDGSLAVTRARYADYALDDLGATFHLDLGNRERSKIDASARKLRRGERTIEHARLGVDGTRDAHTLLLHLQTAETELSADLRGGYGAREWEGEIAGVAITGAYGKWSLEHGAPLHVGPDRVRAGPLCLHTAGAGRACGEVDWPTAGPGRAALQAQALPLAWFQPLLPGTLRARGTVTASADVRFEQRRPISADAELRLAPGALYLPDQDHAAIAFDGGTGRLRLDPRGLRADIDVAFAGDDHFSAELALPRFHPSVGAGKDQPLAGRVRARLNDLSRFVALLPDLERPRGRVDADFALGGTLALPTLRGAAVLADGSANVPALGIRARKANMRASADGARTLHITGDVASGPGVLTIDGALALRANDAWDAALRLGGERVEVANTSQAWALASPELTLAARPGAIELQGRIDIPEAKLTPKPVATPVPVSRDVVIVNAPEEIGRAPPGWAVTSQVRITLGDRVTFDGFGLTGNISGGVVAVDSPDRLTTARGELRINDGMYEAYGRKLEIERGRLLFAGGPVDNPGIDARAIRRVDEITAGIAIGGTLKAPQLSLFSDPPLSESDTLSYLLFGRPLESTSGAQGRALAGAATALKLSGGEMLAERLAARFGIEEVGIESGTKSEDAALVLGKHLSPRLYVNYSIGLFEQINVLRLRYQLSASWALQVESGTYAGADLLYTIER